jgi:nucleoside-specific outer membrane channel protein Tsx
LRSNKTKRADDFCLGWVYTVVSKINVFANTQEEERAIQSYVANLNWGRTLKPISRSTLKDTGANDFANGNRAADSVQIQNGIDGKNSRAVLLEEGR